MKISITGKFFFLIFFTLSQLDMKAQDSTNSKILGCWKLVKVAFIKPSPDSNMVRKGSMGIETCFDKGGKFTTKQKIDNKETILGTGTYIISPDGKTLDQKRDAADDNGIDPPAEIVRLDKQHLSFKTDNVILHFEKNKDN